MKMRLYKYLPAEFALRVLAENRIKISEFHDMNDPFELRAAVLSDPDADSLLDAHSREKYGALCLCRNWTNPLLWAHYADKHRGMCLGFEVASTVPLNDPTYVESQQMLDSRILYDAIATGDTSRAKEVIMARLTTKFKAWNYEEEVRIITERKDKDGDLYFYDFTEELKPSEVIVGVRCSVTRVQIEQAVTGYSHPIRIFKVRLAYESLSVIEDDTGF